MSRPFRADSCLPPTQGVALGWYVAPLWGSETWIQCARALPWAAMSLRPFGLGIVNSQWSADNSQGVDGLGADLASDRV